MAQWKNENAIGISTLKKRMEKFPFRVIFVIDYLDDCGGDIIVIPCFQFSRRTMRMFSAKNTAGFLAVGFTII